MTNLARRSFLGGTIAALISAPAIVRYKSIMPVKAMSSEWIGISTLDAYAEYAANVLGWAAKSPERMKEIEDLIAHHSYSIVPWSDEEVRVRLKDERQNPYA